MEEEKNKKIDNLGTLQKLKTLNIKTLLLKSKVHFTSEEDTMLKDTEKILYDYLNKECLLCVKEMISSTQIDFGDENELGNFALQAKAELEEEFKYRKIYCIDTLIYSTGLGLLGVKASILRSNGKNFYEVRDYIEENKCCVHEIGFFDDLSFVAAKDRLTKSKAFMGKSIGIKPMGEFDYNGLTTVIGKAKGYQQSIDNSFIIMKKFIVNTEEQIVFIGVANRMKQALEFKKRIEKEVKPKSVIIMDVFPSDDINVGPG